MYALLALSLALAPTPPERDPVRAEAVADEATALGRALCAALQARRYEELAGLLAPGFAGGAPDAPGPGTLDAAGFAAALERRLAPAGALRRCSLKPFTFATDARHARASARMTLLLSGVDRGGARFSDRGDLDAEFVRAGKALRLASVAFGPRTRTAGGAPEFEDVTEAVGLPRSFAEAHELPGVGLFGLLDNGGLAVADYDGDGLPDVYVVRDGPNLLFHNDGDGRFTEVGRAAGADDPGDGRAALFVDLDNDGDLDLVVANRTSRRSARGLRLYRNDGGRFTDVTASSGAALGGALTALAAADVDGDGLLDLYVGRYGHGQRQNPLDAHDGEPNLLLRNLGGLRFREEAAAAGVAGREWTLAAAFADLDGDLKPDLLVVNDFGSPRLYRNASAPGRPRFEEVTAAAGLVDPGNGMGADVGDADGDGRPDLYVSKMYSKAGNRLLSQRSDLPARWLDAARRAARGNSLFLNRGGLRFEEAGEEAGVRRAGWAWSTEFADVDLDGDEDLFVTNGYRTGARDDDL